MLRTVLVSMFVGLLLLALPARAEDLRAAIDALNAKMMADSRAGDAKALASAFADDAVMLAPDATRIAGRTAIEALWKSWIDAGMMKSLALKSTEVGGSGDLAYTLGEFTQQVPLKSGELAHVTGNYLSVLKRGEDGVWRIWLQAWEGRHEQFAMRDEATDLAVRDDSLWAGNAGKQPSPPEVKESSSEAFRKIAAT